MGIERKTGNRMKTGKKKRGRLTHGSCSVCGRTIGGLSGLTAWRCSRCRKLFCKDCCPVGSTPKKLVCPECGTELQPLEQKKSFKYPSYPKNVKSLKGSS
jgi:hypothetical protein